jgi:prepilin-type N-terminal cleavage/methylation domain-containing protein
MGRGATAQASASARPSGGFTLIEVLIALAIASLTLVAALSAIGTAQRNTALAQLKSQGCMLAREKIAELDANDYPAPDPKTAINPGAAVDQLIWLDEGEFENTDELFGSEKATWRSDFYWQTILESAPGMEGIRMLTVRVYTKRFRARRDQARWRDYIKEDYELLVEIVTYRAAHYWAEADAK